MGMPRFSYCQTRKLMDQLSAKFDLDSGKRLRDRACAFGFVSIRLECRVVNVLDPALCFEANLGDLAAFGDLRKYNRCLRLDVMNFMLFLTQNVSKGHAE